MREDILETKHNRRLTVEIWPRLLILSPIIPVASLYRPKKMPFLSLDRSTFYAAGQVEFNAISKYPVEVSGELTSSLRIC
jgi:hypothetical protein